MQRTIKKNTKTQYVAPTVDGDALKHPKKKDAIPADLRALGITTLEELKAFRAE